MSLLTKFLKATTTKPVVIGSETIHVKCWTLNDKRIFNTKMDAIRDDEHRDENSVRLLLASSLCDEQGVLAYPDPVTIEVEQIPDDVLQTLIEHVKKVQRFVDVDADPND